MKIASFLRCPIEPFHERAGDDSQEHRVFTRLPFLELVEDGDDLVEIPVYTQEIMTDRCHPYPIKNVN